MVPNKFEDLLLFQNQFRLMFEQELFDIGFNTFCQPNLYGNSFQNKRSGGVRTGCLLILNKGG